MQTAVSEKKIPPKLECKKCVAKVLSRQDEVENELIRKHDLSKVSLKLFNTFNFIKDTVQISFFCYQAFKYFIDIFTFQTDRICPSCHEIKEHHGWQAFMNHVVSCTGETDKPYKCIFCMKEFKDREALKIHKRNGSGIYRGCVSIVSFVCNRFILPKMYYLKLHYNTFCRLPRYRMSTNVSGHVTKSTKRNAWTSIQKRYKNTENKTSCSKFSIHLEKFDYHSNISFNNILLIFLGK